MVCALFVMDPFGVAAPSSWPPDPGSIEQPPLDSRAVALGALRIAQHAIDLLHSVTACSLPRSDTLVPPTPVHLQEPQLQASQLPRTPTSTSAPTAAPPMRPKPSASTLLASPARARPSSTTPTRLFFAAAGPPPFERVRRRRTSTTPRKWPASLSLHDASIFCDCSDLFAAPEDVDLARMPRWCGATSLF